MCNLILQRRVECMGVVYEVPWYRVELNLYHECDDRVVALIEQQPLCDDLRHATMLEF